MTLFVFNKLLANPLGGGGHRRRHWELRTTNSEAERKTGELVTAEDAEDAELEGRG